MAHIDRQFRNTCDAFPNITYLQNDVYEFPDVSLSLFGSTLWTHVPAEHARAVKQGLRDYQAIPDFKPEDATRL
jgi:hypothetical protein